MLNTIPKERFMVQGKRLDNGELVTGYLLADTAPCSFKAKGKCACSHDGSTAYIFVWDDGLHEYDDIEVDPASVEPVALPVSVPARTYGNGIPFCPCCGERIGGMRGRSYCPDCGQRVSWPERREHVH